MARVAIVFFIIQMKPLPIQLPKNAKRIPPKKINEEAQVLSKSSKHDSLFICQHHFDDRTALPTLPPPP